MGRVLTNATSLAYAIQDGFNDLGGSPSWKTVEPNGSITFGADITTEPRRPISKKRQRRKGSITDLDSEVGYEADLTLDSLMDFVEGFAFARAVNYDLVFQGADVASGTTVTIPAATAAQAAKIQWATSAQATIFWGDGYANAGNNGLHVLTADLAPSGTTLTFGGSSLVAETAPTNAKLSVCGIRASAGDIDLDVTSGVGTLTSASDIDFTTLGLTKGQFIHIGGVTLANQLDSGGTGVYGFARITNIAAGALTLDKLDSTLVTDDGTGDTVDILFGRFVRNVATDDADYLERYYQFEAGFENLFETDPPSVTYPDGFEYALDNLCNSLEFNFPLTSLAKLTPSFIGTDTEAAVDNNSRKTNADTPVEPLETTAINTSADYARLRITDVDETGLTTDFKDWTLTLNNNGAGEKVQGFLGSKFINVGTFEVDVQGTFLFTSPLVPARIRSNTTVTMDVILQNSDGAFALDLPAMTLGDGGRDYAVNESVRISLTGEAFEDPTLGTSLGVSLFPVTPTSYAA